MAATANVSFCCFLGPLLLYAIYSCTPDPSQGVFKLVKFDSSLLVEVTSVIKHKILYFLRLQQAAQLHANSARKMPFAA